MGKKLILDDLAITDEVKEELDNIQKETGFSYEQIVSHLINSYVTNETPIWEKSELFNTE